MNRYSKIISQLFLFILFTTIMSSCGGGGGGDGYTPDNISPVILSTSPNNGFSDVVINSTISATFSESLDASTVNDSSFYVVDDFNNPVVGTISYNGATIDFTPLTMTKYSTFYTAYLTKSITDLSGNALLNDFSWSFRTISAPVTGITPPSEVYAAAGDGVVTISWSEVNEAEIYNIYTASVSGVTSLNYSSLPAGAMQTVYSYQPLSYTFTGLENNKTYYFVITAVSAADISIESNEVSSTPAIGNTATLTLAPTNLTDTSVTLDGSFNNPIGYTTTAWFEYGTTLSYGNTTTAQAYSASGSIPMIENLSSLADNTSYHYRLVTQNSTGTYYGQDQTFTTAVTPNTLLSDLDAPMGLPFDGTYIYWMEVYSNRVRRLDVSNDTESTIASNMAFGGNSGQIAIDSSYIYLSAGGTAIRRMNHDGSNPLDSFSTVAMSSPNQLVAHSTGLYIRESWCDTTIMLMHQTISRISLDGLTRTQLFERPGYSPGACSGSGFGGGMVVDDNYLYWTDYYNDNIQKLPLAGGTPVTIATSLSRPGQLLLDGTNLYVSHANGIDRIDLNLGTSVSVISNLEHGAMVKDGGYLYVLKSNEIKKLDLNTGEVTTTYIADQGYTSSPVATSNHLYWITGGNHYYPPLGTLKQIAKP